MKKKYIGWLCVLMTVPFLFAGCNSQGSPNETTAGGTETEAEETEPAASGKDTLVVALSSEARSFDPFGSNDSTSSVVKDQMFDTLFVQDENNEVVPSLVDTYEWVDDNTLHLTIKDGIKFHNDAELTLDDVLYTLQVAAESEYTTWIVENIDIENSTILNDGETLEIKMLNPKGDQLAALCFLYVVSESTVTAEGYDPEATPIGSGPFVFKEQFQGDRIEFTSNADYWGGAPAFDNLTLRIITENASRTIEVETGGVDVIYGVGPADLATLEANENVKIWREPNFVNNYIGFNTQREPFDDPLVRQAITYGTDKEGIVKAVFGDIGTPATGPISPAIWGYSDDVTQYTYDVEKAKELLAEAGYPDGFSTTITVSDNQQRMDIAEIFQNQMRQIGIEVETEVLENATYLDRVVASDFNIFSLGWTTTTGDADYGLYETFHSSTPTWANTTRYSNPEVDALLEEGRSSVDPDVRLNAYAEAQKIIVDECPEIFLWDGEEVFATGSNVNGLQISPSGRHNFSTIYFD